MSEKTVFSFKQTFLALKLTSGKGFISTIFSLSEEQP